jgi:hypothetical protein
MKTRLLVGGLMMLMVGCSERNRFEILQQSPDRITVLFDKNTGDILKIAQSGYIENLGPFGAAIETGKRK